MAEKQTTAGGGLFSKLVVVLLLALAVGLYLRIVMVDADTAARPPAQQASVRVIEGTEQMPKTPAAPARDLPADQMALLIEVFDPH